MRCEVGAEGGCEGRGSCTSEKQLGRLSSPQPNPLPAASQLAPPAAHAARGLSGGRQPPRRRLLGRSGSSGDSVVEPVAWGGGGKCREAWGA